MPLTRNPHGRIAGQGSGGDAFSRALGADRTMPYNRRNRNYGSMFGVQPYRKNQGKDAFLLPPQEFKTSKLNESRIDERPLYTVVLDLDETLIHFDAKNGNYLVRPFCVDFLAEVTKLYEIVIFTAASKDYADTVLDALDPQNTLISHRLYR